MFCVGLQIVRFAVFVGSRKKLFFELMLIKLIFLCWFSAKLHRRNFPLVLGVMLQLAGRFSQLHRQNTWRPLFSRAYRVCGLNAQRAKIIKTRGYFFRSPRSDEIP